jgi:hypothetical protein
MMTATPQARGLIAPHSGKPFGAAAQAFMNEGVQRLQDVLENSIYWKTNSQYWFAVSQLSSLLDLRSNWDSYGAPAPNRTAVENALHILSLMPTLGLPLTSIVPSAEGGVGFCFKSGNRYADIESSNEGEIIGVRYVGMEAPILIEADNTDDSLKAALVQIKDHMDGRASLQNASG